MSMETIWYESLNLSVGIAIRTRTSNERFSHNLNMEITELLHCPNRQVYSLPLVLLHVVLLVQHHTNSLQVSKINDNWSYAV